MYSHYFYWHYIVVPLWLIRFFWTVHQALLQMFSVRVMVTTLFWHWRRDYVAYRSGSLSGLLHAAAWNSISRAVGLIARTSIILGWVISASIFILLAAGLFVFFIMAPVLAAVAIVYGLVLAAGGG